MSESKHVHLTTMDDYCYCPDDVTGTPTSSKHPTQKPWSQFWPFSAFSLPTQHITVLLSFFFSIIRSHFSLLCSRASYTRPLVIISWWVFFPGIMNGLAQNMFDQACSVIQNVLPDIYLFAIHSFHPPLKCPALTHPRGRREGRLKCTSTLM